MGNTLYRSGVDSSVTSHMITDFMEMHTEGRTVRRALHKIEGSTARAQAEFARLEDVSIVTTSGDDGLVFDSSLVEVTDAQNDAVVPVAHHESSEGLQSGILHVGCQLGEDKFGTLWKHEDVRTTYNHRFQSFTFFLQSGEYSEYMLHLSHDCVSEIKLVSQPGHSKMFLLIHLHFGSPKIFKNEPSNFNTKPRANQWVRVTDFTPSLSFGQSSALCLELKANDRTFVESIAGFYREARTKLKMRNKPSFSTNQSLVPIVDSPSSLPFGILFKVNSLIQHGCIPGPNLDGNFFRLVDPNRFPLQLIEYSLEKLLNTSGRCYDPARWLKDLYQRYLASNSLPASPFSPSDEGLVLIRRVRVTPTKVLFFGPEANLSNRVLRRYHNDVDNFIRVSFADDDFDRLRSNIVPPWLQSTDDRRRAPIYQRIITTLRDGIHIGEKKFEFLGFSNSQLRESSLWMFASRPGLSAEDIRREMGDFSAIRIVAKHAARLGQSFSSSRETSSVPISETECVPDITTTTDGVEYVFSDGIGKISTELAQSIARKLRFRDFFPSAFQIRYGGFKGVVAVDPNSSKKLSLRKSMKKFESSSTSLDVLSWSKYMPCYLNREVITLLSTLGVRDAVFERKQNKALQLLDSVLTDPHRARRALELTAPGRNMQFLREMLRSGYSPTSDPFLLMVLETYRASKLLDLRTKSKIFVPKGRCMMGCLDETGSLEYGQVFIQTSMGKRRSIFDEEGESAKRVVTGRAVVAKNPCLHPGDVRVLAAIDVPELHHMVDCVVFPQKGKRPHPNECSGSDLDGDLYFVSWDAELIPSEQHPPMDYSSPQCSVMDHDITIEEIQEFFADCFLNDELGKICTAHTVFADWKRSKAKSKECRALALQASIAVDFPKTGVPAKVPRELRVHKYPDFMEKANKPSYESTGVLGKLYRVVKDIASPVTPFTKEAAMQRYDGDMEIEGFEEYEEEAFNRKYQYDDELDRRMKYYGIETEAEMISGCILKTVKWFDRKSDLEDILLGVGAIKKQATAWFEDGLEEAQRRKASAAYFVTYHPKYWGRYDDGSGRGHFLSFPWCAYEKLLDIKNSKATFK